MRYFVFVDTAYYPYVDEPLEADSLEEARRIAAERLRPGDDTEIYLAPAEAVTKVGPMFGPTPKPVGILALQEELNRRRGFGLGMGGFSACAVRIEPGTTR